MKTYAGILDELANKESASIYLQNIPYDGTSTWGKGADKGFQVFLDASENMELYDIETDSEVYQKGVYMPEPLTGFASPEEMFKASYERTRELLKNDKFLSFFGGEHSISIGIIKAFYERYDELTVLQIDAHADLRPEYMGTAYNHACAMYDASKNANLIQIGIRSMDVSEKEHMDYNKCYFAHQMYNSEDWMQESIDKMTDNIYISLDLDAFDSGILASTGTPEPGGLEWYTVIKYLKMVFEQKNVVGFDIVELAPLPHDHASAFLVAKLYYKMLSYKFFV